MGVWPVDSKRTRLSPGTALDRKSEVWVLDLNLQLEKKTKIVFLLGVHVLP